ncbi:MAG TPA: penicillin-binding protein 1C, partial [Candidatus Manganitrophaceae bacterium]|nr:penicillin-binding protein 1C [Candidatus Manganitrophaceae bacterium]
ISPSLQRAVIGSEDQRFYDHHGVDWRAIGSALLKGALSFSTRRGASTITMQLAAQLDESLRPADGQRSLGQKWNQMKKAEEIERVWTKPQVLEAYLNTVYFRGELQGVAAASHGLFGKEPHGLDETEGLILAVLIRNPNAPTGKVASRACRLASRMKRGAGCEVITRRAQEALSAPHPMILQQAFAPHVARQLLKTGKRNRSGENVSIRSTLDMRLQRFAIEVLRHQLADIRSQNATEGAVLVVENTTGQVLAYIGNSGGDASFRYVDGVRAQRQAGSTLKPFLYGLALEKRLVTPASMIDDSPLDISLEGGIYRPKNYDNDFAGPVSVRTALASSLNVPAIKTLGLVGQESFMEKLKEFGFRNLNESDGFYGPSLALGSADITLWDLVQAYRALANEGVWSPLVLSKEDIPPGDQRQALSREAAFITSDILSDREARSRTFGLESPLSTHYWSAVKTGTSKDMRDNWCVGYSDRYTVGVWIGNFSGSPMWSVSGITGAAPVWLEIMNRLHADRPSLAPKPPAGISAKKDAGSPSGSSRREWFIRGTEPIRFEEKASLKEEKILYPVSGEIIAFDPDIPREDQKVIFEAQPADRPLRWRLNGADLGSSEKPMMWSPEQGKYELSLVTEGTRIVDSIQFEVKGRSMEE